VQPTQAIFEQRDKLLSADTTTLAPVANACKVALIVEPFVPGPDTDFTALTEATFDGYAKITGATGTQIQTIDPLTGASKVQMKLPAGGWVWETTGVTNLPQTVYGWCLVDNAATTTYGSGIFDTPVELTGVNQQVTIPQVEYVTQPGTMV
jgi:hypothetical protein